MTKRTEKHTEMADKVSVKFLFFAKARELVGTNEDTSFCGKNHTYETLLDEILQLYEALQPIAKNLLLAVNEEYIAASESIQLKDGDNIAIMPPLSGG